MLHLLLNSMLILPLGTSLVMCPLSCLNYPRLTDDARPKAASGGCGCGCCAAQRRPAAGGNPLCPRRSPEKPCSCPCVCKGALATLPGQIRSHDLDLADATPVAFLTAESAELILATALRRVPESPPGKAFSGREIRALIASLLL